MAIQLGRDKLLTFTEAASLIPKRRAGRKTHISTLYRWATRGIRGVVLESIKIGGTSCTSMEALQHFFERLSHGQQSSQQPLATYVLRTNAEEILREARI